MSKTNKGFYTPVNQDKVIGNKMPYYKSSWELYFMRMCDQHPSIIQWGYEVIKIPYENPITGEMTVYVPDFLIMTVDKNGKQHAQLIEIKPKKESALSEAKDKRSKLRLLVNAAKWQAAMIYAKKYGMQFKVVTEDEMFNRPKK